MKNSKKGSEFAQWLIPVLDALKELGGSAKPKTVNDLIAKKQNLPEEILTAVTKTGIPRYYNQVAWARQYLVNSGYIDGSKRGMWSLTEKGQQANLTYEDTEKILLEASTLAAPLLEALQKLGGSGKPREVSELIAKNLDLPPDLLEATLKDGSLRFHNQVAWARNNLVKIGYLDSANRGTWVLTEKGRSVRLTNKNARAELIEDFKKYTLAGKAQESEEKVDKFNKNTDIEAHFIEEERETEEVSLLEILRSLSPKGFEEICGLLLRESGFENVIVSGRSRDGGFDGSGRLSINPFVSLSVTFQCKRYMGSVSRAEVGDFRNSMLGRAEKGIFLTTGTFSSDARKEADRVDPKIELVDGEKLVEMFQQSGLGVKPRQIFDVDTQFFEPYRK
ncbi:MAG TPA: winged helix-turn-helix domain-containing protein [Candidatus Kapabacteria bacterium]|nr:winged helix-turn-helix domain-containing protein [Candidatus Kapabacteria bacterium]